jgi:SAM-dependent methyltransferase
MTKRQLVALAVALRDRGRLFDPADAELQDVFAGSVDRFCDIALKLHGRTRVLDIGAGHGMLVALLQELGHDCAAVDFFDPTSRYPLVYREKAIPFRRCNIEVERLPFDDAAFDAVVCCQVLEHFSHSHLPAIREMFRVLRPGGIIEADVPNVASLRNRSRLLRGRNITYDYAEHYLDAEPVLEGGRSYFPARHNREFTRAELRMLLDRARFTGIEVGFLRSRRYRTGFATWKNLGSDLRDAWPSLRKSLIAYAEKPAPAAPGRR